MFKRLLTFLTLASVVLVQAQAVPHNGLKQAFDELNYGLTVEWDQKDPAFYDQAMSHFKGQLKTLQDQGLSNAELVRFTVNQVKDQAMARDLETALNMITINKMSQEEAQRYVINTLNQSYSQGASWGGEVIAGAIALVVIVAVVAIIAGKARVGEGCYEVWSCEENCLGGACWEDCDYRCVN